ncbi:MAG: hypothetical protein J2P37_02990 [Ktedonobacteraceae bacterium]|nr:hypothetical protein [Ktedonobacteraceae bacterium]MBO0792296.1 hypothetical protein [Ktedonobacteraceae bacterium]
MRENDEKELTRHDIEQLLQVFGQKFAQRRYPVTVHMLLIGGGYMLTQHDIQRITRDVDLYPLDRTWPDTVPPFPGHVYEIAQEIAREQGLRHTWLQTLPERHVKVTGGVPRGSLWRTFGIVEIYAPPADYILFLKLRINRPKDRADISYLFDCLGIQTREQAQALIDHYMPDQANQAYFDISTKLHRWFPSSETNLDC